MKKKKKTARKCYSCDRRRAKYVDGLCAICHKVAMRVSAEMEPLVRAEFDRLAGWVEGLAYMATRTEPSWRHALRDHVKIGDKRPLTTGSILKRVAEELRRTAARVTDPRLCNDNCKGLYFCEKKLGHKGRHETPGLAW